MSMLPENSYFGIFVMLVVAFCLFFTIMKSSSIIGSKLANKREERLKSTFYEAGPETVKQPNRMNSHFYIVTVLFILFDVELVFLYPWAVNFKLLATWGLVEMFLFIIILAIGFIYAWSKGALEWQSIK